jgi:hypothetical protein
MNGRFGNVLKRARGVRHTMSMFENDVRKKDSARVAQQVNQVKNMMNVIVNPIAFVFWLADTTGYFTEFSRKDRKSTECVAKKEIVDMRQDHAIREAFQNLLKV